MNKSRNWQEDKTLCEEMLMNNLKAQRAVLAETPEMPMYWLQQYAEVVKEHAYAKKEAIKWNDLAIAEKERADKAEAREKKLREAIEEIKQLGYSDRWGGGYIYTGESHAMAVRIADRILVSLYPDKEEEAK